MTGAPDHVVVIGGGIAGLTAAYRLTQARSTVTVVEPGPLGGKLQTSVVAGRPIDEGADAFLLRVPWAAALCHDLELDGELISPAARTAHVFVDGVRHVMPTGHLMGVPTDLDALAGSGLMSAAGLARVAEDLARPGTAIDADVAIGPYLRGRLGDEVVDHLIAPLIGGINAGDIDRLSLSAVVPQLDAAARSGEASLIEACRQMLARSNPGTGTGGPPAPVFATPIGGMARLVDALLALMPGLDVEATGATGLALTDSGVIVALANGTTVEASAVVLACPAPVAATLLADIDPNSAHLLSGIDYASVTMTTMALPATAVLGDLDASGCLVPADQGTLATAVSYGTSKWAQWRDPERDDVILRVSAGRHGDTRHLDLDDADLVEALLGDLDRVIGLAGGPSEVRVTRWVDSLPQYGPGHLDRMAELAGSLAHLPAGRVALAGAAYGGVGVPACIHSGEQAAASLGATWPTRRSLRPS